MDVFNCSPQLPNIVGKSFNEAMAAPCWEGEHARVVPFAVIGLVVYVIGFPAATAWVLRKHRELIKEDQLLRAMDVGRDRRTNPNAYELRKRYHKLYYLFKPSMFLCVQSVESRVCR